MNFLDRRLRAMGRSGEFRRCDPPGSRSSTGRPRRQYQATVRGADQGIIFLGYRMTDGPHTKRASACAEQDRFECFTYLTVEKSRLYRAIMKVFCDARGEFLLHLRPAEVVERLRGLGGGDPHGDEVDVALDALVHWGNLQSYRDPVEVSTIAEFQRRRLLYQLTAAGEAAERAAEEFLESLDRPITLETGGSRAHSGLFVRARPTCSRFAARRRQDPDFFAIDCRRRRAAYGACPVLLSLAARADRGPRCRSGNFRSVQRAID